VAHVEEGVAAQRSCGADLVIARGRRQPDRHGQGVAAVAVNGGGIADYLGQNKLPGRPAVDRRAPTAGTGSEVTRFCIITDSATSVRCSSAALI